MFSKISRYRKLPSVVTEDPQGRQLESVTLRTMPEVTGIFFHTVEAADRLDHLGYKYYRQPRKWWRICDANPDFLSPQALLGKDPIITGRFPLTFSGVGQPPWASLIRALSSRTGVENVSTVDDIRLVPQQQLVSGQLVTVNVERHDLAVIVTYNQMNVSAADLIAIMVTAGFSATQQEVIGRVGKKIVVPPDVVA